MLRRWQAPSNYVPSVSFSGEAADGTNANGDGIGYVGGVNVIDSTADSIVLEVSFAGRGANLKHVDVAQRVSLRWGGAFDGPLGKGGRIHAEFKRPGMCAN